MVGITVCLQRRRTAHWWHIQLEGSKFIVRNPRRRCDCVDRHRRSQAAAGAAAAAVELPRLQRRSSQIVVQRHGNDALAQPSYRFAGSMQTEVCSVSRADPVDDGRVGNRCQWRAAAVDFRGIAPPTPITSHHSCPSSWPLNGHPQLCRQQQQQQQQVQSVLPNGFSQSGCTTFTRCRLPPKPVIFIPRLACVGTASQGRELRVHCIANRFIVFICPPSETVPVIAPAESSNEAFFVSVVYTTRCCCCCCFSLSYGEQLIAGCGRLSLKHFDQFFGQLYGCGHRWLKPNSHIRLAR